MHLTTVLNTKLFLNWLEKYKISQIKEELDKENDLLKVTSNVNRFFTSKINPEVKSYEYIDDKFDNDSKTEIDRDE